MVHEKGWLEGKHDVTHFRVFDSLCYENIPDAKRNKLEDKSEPIILHHFS